MSSRTQKVLLVGWDAADWKVIRPVMDAGQMPHVRKLVETGASGQIATLHPPLSPMLWTSIATGKRPFKHGIHGFSEPTLDGRGIQPVSNLSRTAKALWNILNQNGLRSTVVGWWPSHPAEPIRGAMVSDHYHRAHAPLGEPWPLPAHAVQPSELAATLAGLRVHPEELAAELVESFIPLAREIDQESDKRLAALLRTLAECMSVQAAALWLMEHQAADLVAVYFDAIDHFSHAFMKYHPPRQSWIGEREFELYNGVIAEAYRFHDQMLGELIAKAGQGATVVLLSDHGFHPDHLRPATIPDIPAGPAVEHRDYGVLALAGPHIRQGAVLQGASVLDLTPTVLTLFGLAVGEDMDGKVLTQAFRKAPRMRHVPSWEEIPGEDGRHPGHTRLDAVGSHAALEQMVALGYIEAPAEDAATAVRKTVQELRYNLGEAYQDAGRHAEAREIFLELRSAEPAELRFALRLFTSCAALGRIDEMREIADGWSPSPLAETLKAHVAIAEERFTDALELLKNQPAARGELYLKMRRWRDAGRIFDALLKDDPDLVPAHLGLAQVALKQGRFKDAAHAALGALERVHHEPRAHYLLGLALAGMQEYARAAEAFRAAILCNPHYPEAHRKLAALLEKQLGDGESAREHRGLARRMTRSGPARAVQAPVRRVEEPVFGFRSQDGEAVPLEHPVIVVTGLPRSGTSMTMQMLAAGGVEILADGQRDADEHNPRGYFEYEPVKKLWQNSAWLREARGKAVKIVAPLLPALPPGLPCRVILCVRDLDQVLDSQARMLKRGNENRELLRSEYSRLLARVSTLLAKRLRTQVLTVDHARTMSDPRAVADELNCFLGGGFNPARMAAVVEPAPHHSAS